MPYESNCGLEVLKNLFRRQRLIEAGDVAQYEYRPHLFASTGVRRGVDGGGRARAFERFRLAPAFAGVSGSSTGGAMLQFFIAGQVREHLNIYWNEAATRQFIDFRRFARAGRPVQDTQYLADVFRGKLDHAAAMASPTRFHVGVTCARSGAGSFLDAKEESPDIVTAVQASMSIPGLCGGPAYVGGRQYYDGAGAMGMPICHIEKQFAPTDLVIFANCPKEKKDSVVGRIGAGLLLQGQELPVQRAFLTRHKRFAEGLEYLRKEAEFRWMLFLTDNKIGQYESNPRKLEAVADRADEETSALLAKAKAEVDAEEPQALAAE